MIRSSSRTSRTRLARPGRRRIRLWRPERTPNISRDPRFTFWRTAMDHIEHSRGHEWAFAGDVAYNFLDDSLPEAGEVRRALRGSRPEHQIHDLQLGFAERSLVGQPASSWTRSASPKARRSSTTGTISSGARRRLRRQHSIMAGTSSTIISRRLNSPSWFRLQRRPPAATATNRWVPLAQRAGRRFRARRSCRADIQHVSQND